MTDSTPEGVTVIPVRPETAADDTRSLTRLFYGSIGVAASLALFLAFYWSLRLNASIDNLIRNFLGVPLYFWPYVLLTLAAIALFGVNASLLVYRWRRYGRPRLRGQGSTSLGALVGVAASACPVCGSVILSAIGIAGGLAAFPLQGLELKTLSVAFLLLPIWLIRRDLRNLDEQCRRGVCPNPRDASFQESDRPWLLAILGLIAVLAIATWQFLKFDPAVARLFAQRILNQTDNRLQDAVAAAATNTPLFAEVVGKVLPGEGFQSTIALGDSVVKLVEAGVIDHAKFAELYKGHDGPPAEVRKGVEWENVNPKIALGKDYSTISGWSGTVAKEVAARGLVPQTQDGAGCGV